MKVKKKVLMALAIIIIITGITLLSNREKPELIVVYGEIKKNIETEFIYSHIDSETFPAVVRSSGNKPVETEYTGIELSKLFDSLNIPVGERILFDAYDGYRIVLSKDELNEPKNLYLAYERDGEKMKSKKQGGNGPFQLIIRRDPFSQRWIKHIKTITMLPAS